MKWKTEKHSLNAKGKFYVDQKMCILDGCCETAAPNNFVYDENTGSGYYVLKQPETAEELKQMREAIYCCPVEAVMDDGETNDQKKSVFVCVYQWLKKFFAFFVFLSCLFVAKKIVL